MTDEEVAEALLSKLDELELSNQQREVFPRVIQLAFTKLKNVRKAHAERQAKYRKKKLEEDPESFRAYNALVQRRHSQTEKYRQKRARWMDAHREEVLSYQRQYSKEHTRVSWDSLRSRLSRAKEVYELEPEVTGLQHTLLLAPELDYPAVFYNDSPAIFTSPKCRDVALREYLRTNSRLLQRFYDREISFTEFKERQVPTSEITI